MRRRVVVTGIGTISGAGDDASEFLTALRIGDQSGFCPIHDPRLAGLRATHIARVRSPLNFPSDPEAVRKMDRVVHLALCAAREALSKARMIPPLGERSAVILGTCSGGMPSIERHYEALSAHREILDRALLFSKRYYTPAKVLAWATGASGPVKTVVTACAAGVGAIAEAAQLIRHGLCDVALAGGSDAFAPSTLLGFDALKATCEGICTPFSTNIGLNIGEGAGFLALESLESAERREVPILAEILGSGQSNDAYHPTSPDPSCKAQVAAITRALADAGLTADNVDYINAHGTGTRANDAVESRTIAKVFGARAKAVPVSSTKALIGHCLGAAGVLEAAATILATRSGFCPPTFGGDAEREGCSLDYVRDLNRPYDGRVALTNSFGFGGNNACLLIDPLPQPERSVACSPTPPTIKPVITGIGGVHALGVGFEDLRHDEKSGVAPMDRLSGEGGDIRVGGLVPHIDGRTIDRRLELKGMGTLARYATFSSRMALQSGGIRPKPNLTADVGTVMGLAAGDLESESAHLTAAFESNFQLDRVDAFPFVVQNAAAGVLARTLFLKGHSTVISTGWGAGLTALATCALAVETGMVRSVLAIGCDILTPRSYLDGLAVGLYGDHPTALIPGEGAATLLVEHPEAAARRSTRPIAEIIGYAEATDTDHLMDASGHAAYWVLRTALERAQVAGTDVSTVAITLSDHPVHVLERAAVDELLPDAVRYSLYPRLGFPEAALPLLNLGALLETAPKGSLIAALSLSEEGVAAAIVIRTLSAGCHL
jgi:3-oxoacyl-[acyl-carrier-protein] synthase II